MVVPVANLIAIPAALVGSTVTRVVKFKAFLQTEAGQTMENYYKRAADLGHEKAKKRLAELQLYK